jgi:hypothetical protein
MSNFLRKILSMGSQTAPRVADDLVESKALQKRIAEESVEPEVLGKAAPRAAAADDISDAVFEEVTPTTGINDLSWMSRMDPRLKKYAKGAGAVGAGAAAYSMMGEDEPSVQVPLAPVEPIKAESPKTPEEIKKEAKKTVRTEPPKQDGLDFDALSKKFDEEMAKLPKDQEPDEFDIASRRANDNMLMAMLGKSATQIGGGIASLGAGSQVKIDSSGFDDLAKIADRPLTELQEKQKFDRAKAELDDDKAMRDPNSEISKLVSGLAVKTGLVKPGQQVSAMSLKNSGVNLGNLLATMEAAKARKEAAALAKDAKLAQKEEKLSEAQKKFTQGLRKEATSGVLGKQYATFATGQRMAGSLEKFAQDPSGYKDYASLMGGLKALQGDESVVREAEVRMGVSSTSAINAALNHLDRLRSGKTLQPEQRKQMIDTIKILTDASRQQYMYSVQPILEQARMEGIDPELILSGSLSPASGQAESLTTGNTRTFKSKQAPGSVVTVKSGKKYKIGEDGVTGTEIP